MKIKQALLNFIKWIARKLYRLLKWLVLGILALPDRIKKIIYRVAHWGKEKLDQRIDILQREKLHTIIFKTETPEGRRFDTILTWIIIFSIGAVILESVSTFHRTHWWIFFVLEWIFTLIFTIEYIMRLYSSKNTVRYATSFFGIVDLLAIIPTYLGVFFLGAQHLLIVRSLRLLRIFRIFKMGKFVTEGEMILSAMRASRTKIYVFISFILIIAMIIGSVLYIVEGGVNPKLDNIPKGIYWAIVTLTTVGYGDVTPVTTLGRVLATLVMVMGYGVIAVPTGIVTAEITGRVMNLKEVKYVNCTNCNQGEHHTSAKHCHRCGEPLEKEEVVNYID